MSSLETGFSVLRKGVMLDREVTVTDLQFLSVTAHWQVLAELIEFTVTDSRRLGMSHDVTVTELQFESVPVTAH